MSRIKDIFRIGISARKWVTRQAMIGALDAFEITPDTTCPCCGQIGKFWPFGLDNLPGSVCPSCFSLQRHRLFKLALDDGFINLSGKLVLHFAPEDVLVKIIKSAGVSSYISADLEPGRASRILNIESIDMPSDSIDVIICFHVLEHVNDRAALAELYRILRPDGVLVAMVPLIEGWSTTYEDSDITTERDREMYFGQNDHVRMFGSDFRDRVRQAGFQIDEYTADGKRSVLHGLIRGEKVFRCSKPVAA